jgi:hypothetical protein
MIKHIFLALSLFILTRITIAASTPCINGTDITCQNGGIA